MTSVSKDPSPISSAAAKLALVESVSAKASTVTLLTPEIRETNKAKFNAESVQQRWQQHYGTSVYSYNMNSKIDENRLSTGIGNRSVFLAILTGTSKFGFSLSEEGICQPLSQEHLPKPFVLNPHSSSNNYFFTGQRRWKPKLEQPSIGQTAVNESFMVRKYSAQSHTYSTLAQSPLEFKSDRLKNSNQEVDQETLKYLADDLGKPDSSVAFYTGAGISIAAGISDLRGYHKRIVGEDGELETKEDFDKLTEKVLANPGEILSSIKEFYQSFYFAEPTLAHNAISDLIVALEKPILIFTENHDLLHQKTGAEVMPMGPVDQMKTNLDFDYLRNLDYLICTGLSHDDRGFIAFLREINPKLKIVANTLVGQMPSFIYPNESKDIYLPGDAHVVFPKLLALVQEILLRENNL